MKSIEELIRPNINKLTAYSSARNEYSGYDAHVFLDANENPFNKPYNRYPDPLQKELKALLSKVKGVQPEQICLGNGSDETIDLAYRCFCNPGIDNVVAIEPTYGMYKVCAEINDVEYRPVLLNKDYSISSDSILSACDDHTKLIWICSPNNPTGNNINRNEIIKILTSFDGLVIVDEAYSDFSTQKPFRHELNAYPNIIVLNTMSKAWGCAGIRLGMAFAQKEIIDIFNKVKYPYNINILTQKQAIKELQNPYEVNVWVNDILRERELLVESFKMLPMCEEVYHTDANFFLAKMKDAQAIYTYLVSKGIIVRNRSKIELCDNCLRVTIGTKMENTELLSVLRQY